MDLAAIVKSLDVTRALIESEVATPGELAVTSAVRGDGKSLVASGLAHGLAGVGHGVLLVTGDIEAAETLGLASAPKLDVLPFDIMQYVTPGKGGLPSRLSLAAPGVLATASMDAVQATFARIRENFAYTVLDTAVLVESGMAVAFATEADGVVIALKKGRGALEVDRELLKILRAAKTPILGVVTTQAGAIKAFNGNRGSKRRFGGARLRDVEPGGSAGGPLSVRIG